MMRILFTTNYYPPCTYDWGYMQLCEEAADGLAARGHDVAVLTSVYRHGEEPDRPYPVYRSLPIDPDWHSGQSAMMQFFFSRKEKEAQALTALRGVIERFQPDIIFAWHMIGLSRAMLQEAENWPGIPMTYYFANYMPELPDEYLRYWQAPGQSLGARMLKGVFRPLAVKMLALEEKPIHLQFENSVCVSDYVRQRLVSQGLISSKATVIHNGIDLDQFSRSFSVTFTDNSRPLRCLVAGRVAAEKGVHTVVEAFAALHESGRTGRLHLDIIGNGPADYEAQLHRLVETAGLQGVVTFHPPVPREQMPQILGQHDILILPSEYAEPLARAGQEAMGMGLLVIGTNTGGSGELLVHEETGLVFAAGDAVSLAKQLRRVLDEPYLADKLAENGRGVVHDHFHIERMVDQLEAYLSSLIAEKKVPTDGNQLAA